MNKNNNLPYYGFIAFVFIVAKLIYRNIENEELLLLLQPVSYLVGFFTNSALHFTAENGFFMPDLNIIINESCSGFNFWLNSFVVISFAVVTEVAATKRKIILLLLTLLLTYFLTIIANTSRIISILKVNSLMPTWNEKYEWFHAAQGTFVYLFYLIIFYLMAVKYLKSK